MFNHCPLTMPLTPSACAAMVRDAIATHLAGTWSLMPSVASPADSLSSDRDDLVSVVTPSFLDVKAPADGHHGSAAAATSILAPPPHLVHVRCLHSSSAARAAVGDGPSPQPLGRGYYLGAPSPGEPAAVHVLLDRVHGARDVAELLRHELVHAADAGVHGLDLGSCGALACSELRAAAAAECAHVWPAWARRGCVRATAAASTRMVFPAHGAACVDALFEQCTALQPAASPVPLVAEALRREAMGQGVG